MSTGNTVNTSIILFLLQNLSPSQSSKFCLISKVVLGLYEKVASAVQWWTGGCLTSNTWYIGHQDHLPISNCEPTPAIWSHSPW